MVKLSKEQIILLHSMAINKTGGLDGIRDEGLLESAINSPFQSFGGVELFPQIESKAAHLAFNIIDKEDYLLAMERSPIKDIEIKYLLKFALTDEINSRDVYMKGIDHSYYYEGYTTYKIEELWKQ